MGKTNVGRLAGKIALITGAASGQGKEVSKLFAREGATVILADLNEKLGKEVLLSIEQDGFNGMFVEADVSKESDVRNMFKLADEEYKRLDILYNNAGVGTSFTRHMAPTIYASIDDWNLVLKIDLTSIFLCCKYGIPLMLKNGRGSIINVSSINALVAMPLSAYAYTAAKGGTVSLTRVLAKEYGKKGIRVNCICPGPIDTPMLAPALEDEKIRRYLEEGNALARIGRPEEVAYAALFLASDEASYVTGHIMTVDGGWTAGWAPER